MKFEKVYNKVKEVPYISKVNAKSLYDFIIENKVTNVLELGFAHGTASCYIAAALDELNEGRLTSVDLMDVEDLFQPSIQEQLTDLKLERYVEVHRMKSGYNWFLHNDIDSCSDRMNHSCQPKYDLIIIDGPKNWTIDSSSFFLCDKLLRNNGWIIWDDYTWTYDSVDGKREVTDGITHRKLSADERSLPHIKEIFELLVLQHQDYGNFIVQEDSDWVWAQKTISSTQKNIKYKHSYSLQALLVHVVFKVIKKIKTLFSKLK